MKTILLFLLLIAFGATAFAQDSMQLAERKKLVKTYTKIALLCKSTYDSLERENKLFLTKFLAYLNKYPESINDQWEDLRKKDLRIASSTDGNFRIYSWDDATGGSDRYYVSVHSIKRLMELGLKT